MVQKKMMWISSMHFCWRVIKHLSYAKWRNTKTVYSIWMRKHSERGKTTQNGCVIYLSMKELLHEIVILFHTHQISSCENERARVNPVCCVPLVSFPHLNARRRYSRWSKLSRHPVDRYVPCTLLKHYLLAERSIWTINKVVSVYFKAKNVILTNR